LEANVNTHHNRHQTKIDRFDTEAPPLPYELDEREMQSIWPSQEGEVGWARWSFFKGASFKGTRMALPSVKTSTVKSKSTAEQFGPALSAKIKEALESDYDPEESIAAIRALLFGPTKQLHDARLEEIVSILEESDRTSQMAFRALEHQCDKLSAKIDLEIKKAADKQDEKLADLFLAVDSKFVHVKTEIDERFDEKSRQTELEIEEIARELNARFMRQDEKLSEDFDMLSKKLDDIFVVKDEQAEKIQSRSTDYSLPGLSNITKRLKALRRNYMGVRENGAG
jgi:hypothetical protein